MRSVPAGSFERLSSPEGLWRAWRQYRRGKSRQPRVAAFDLDADTHVFALHRQLRDGSYRPGRYDVSVIRDPKIRFIAAPALRDRVLQQALIDDIGNYYERGFIDDSYACCSGRGPHRAVLRYLGWTRKFRHRLSLDVRRYFLSIHRPTLCELIGRRLRDARTRELVELLLDHGGTVYRHPLAIETLNLPADPLPPDAGLPIGSYLSQWSGALYLDGLDHFVKRQLKIHAYLRFMDDVSLFSDDPEQLIECRETIAGWLQEQRRLTLNPKRWQVLPTAQPSIFLGYRVSRAGLIPGRKLMRRMRKRLRALRDQDPERLTRSLRSYRGLMTF